MVTRHKAGGEPHGTPEPVPPVLTTQELAKLLRVSETQVRRMNLPSIEVGRGRWRYVTNQVLQELGRRAERGGTAVRRVG